jgi:hypothetical protein
MADLQTLIDRGVDLRDDCHPRVMR